MEVCLHITLTNSKATEVNLLVLLAISQVILNIHTILDDSHKKFLDFIEQRDAMKLHLDKQTESLNSLKKELDGMNKNEYQFEEKVRRGQKQIIPITRRKR
jgi:hypothetical protein